MAYEKMVLSYPSQHPSRRANGGEGFVGRAYLILWPIEKLRELNDAYQVEQYAPGFLIFGSDGGGEAFTVRGGSVSPVNRRKASGSTS